MRAEQKKELAHREQDNTTTESRTREELIDRLHYLFNTTMFTYNIFRCYIYIYTYMHRLHICSFIVETTYTVPISDLRGQVDRDSIKVLRMGAV